MSSLVTRSSARWINWLINAPKSCEWGIYPTKQGNVLYWISYDN